MTRFLFALVLLPPAFAWPAEADLSRLFHRDNCYADSRGAVFKAAFPAMEPAVAIADRDRLWNLLRMNYGPIFSRWGLGLELREIDEAEFGASTFRAPDRAVVLVSKGTRYFQSLTPDSYALMLCHEIGHHLGGAPVSSRAWWSSVEGQADYFSTADCWKRLFPSAAAGLNAALGLTRIVASLKGVLMLDLTLNSRDNSRAATLLEDHPAPLCRWETFRRGLAGEPRPECWLPASLDITRPSWPTMPIR